MSKSAISRRACCADPAALGEPVAPEPVEVLEDEVLFDGQSGDHAAATILGDPPEPGADAADGIDGSDVDAVDVDVPDVGAAVAQSTSTSSVWPLPLTPATPTISPAPTLIDDLVEASDTVAFECDVTQLEHRRGVGRRVSGGGDSGPIDFRPERRRHHRIGGVDVADHQLGELAGVERADRLRRHDAAPSQHRDAIGDGDDLAQLVRDEHDADALGAQPADRAEQCVDVQRGEHGGRLVEDQHATVVMERLEDLDALALADRQLLDASIGVDARRRAASAVSWTATRAARRSTAPRPTPASITFSVTVIGPTRENSWVTTPMPAAIASFGERDPRCRTPTRSSPPSGWLSP